ncbi:MAG: 5'-nucleotidase C-terminal domain-containing protein [Prevotellaceae bacterium]|jgi:2',3'-cyclic-nucleotide 2'-phosphodiesterase (5'-nucleotidase family)|nr:5'-nucleotidase C-terminal domain-containing protein [Prevotellaceae bacterium]
MNIKKIIFLFLLTLSVVSCNTGKWIITESNLSSIPIDASTDAIADKDYIALLEPIKADLDSQLSQVIGYAPEAMTIKKPECLLSNFSADVYRDAASTFLGEEVNIGIVNYGGLRAEIPHGDITKRKIFELMPFENELVIVWITGSNLDDLCQFFASINGEGVSGIKMGIENGKAVDIEINGQPIDREKNYSIAVNDYLAGGNDGMIQLSMQEKRVETGKKLRDILIQHINNETQKGNQITSKLDNRIYLK